MTDRQKELIKSLGYKIIDNTLIGEKKCISKIYYDNYSHLFSIKMKAYIFDPADYESMEMFSITFNHMLGLVYELNLIGG